MRTQAVSDMHCEFYNDNGKHVVEKVSAQAKDVDVLVVAGDLAMHSGVEYPLELLCNNFKHVVYVTGNHEYYQSRRERVHDILDKLSAKLPNLHWLNNSSCEIDGQRFIGGTLWFPDSPTARLTRNKEWMSDFRLIKGFEDWIWNAWNEASEYIKHNVQDNDIVVTHHLPFEQSVDKFYKGEESNCYFLGDMKEKMLSIEADPKLWIHGHTHCRCEYICDLRDPEEIENTLYDEALYNALHEGDEIKIQKISKTRVICNPMAYPNERMPFEIKIVEI